MLGYLIPIGLLDFTAPIDRLSESAGTRNCVMRPNGLKEAGTVNLYAVLLQMPNHYDLSTFDIFKGLTDIFFICILGS